MGIGMLLSKICLSNIDYNAVIFKHGMTCRFMGVFSAQRKLVASTQV